jgi:hypothetical protein
MDTSQIVTSGILKKNEDIIDCIEGSMNQISGGVLVITNKRFLFLKRPGLFSKGLNVVFTLSLGDILSVSIVGLIIKQAIVKIEVGEKIRAYYVQCRNIELFCQKLIGAKDSYIDEKTIEAKTIIIEEGKKDSAAEILKKRLARGEITKEEFHDKIQRT